MTGFIFRTLCPKKSAAMCGVTATTRPTKSRLGPVCFEPRDEARARGQADDADEDGQADRVEDPERRLRDPAERRAHGAQPSEDEPHDERAAARRQAERQRAHRDGEEPDEPADDDAEADEDDVGLAARAVRCSRGPCRRARRRGSRRTAGSRSPRLMTVEGTKGISSPPAHELHQRHAAPVELGDLREA